MLRWLSALCKYEPATEAHDGALALTAAGAVFRVGELHLAPYSKIRQNTKHTQEPNKYLLAPITQKLDIIIMYPVRALLQVLEVKKLNTYT